MAKQFKFVDRFGNTNEAAYAVLQSVEIVKNEQRAVLGFAIYRDKAARESGNLQPVHTFSEYLSNMAEIEMITDESGQVVQCGMPARMFDTFFSVKALSGSDPYKQGYLAMDAIGGNLFSVNNAVDV